MQSVKIEINSAEKASRIEILVRLIYWIPIVIVQFVLSIISMIAILVNLITVIILGKRILPLTRFTSIAITYQAKASSYFALATDERPPIIPEELSK